ncbi:E3 binding domain-containing protein, partial [Oligoflexia bacterium]|nr:E3 binding domain-containing protein [Oligoflexia bacterium]
MKVDMLMPQMGESITEATIIEWLKKPGDKIELDEIILEISTDKVDSEIPAPAAGVLSEVLFSAGDTVPVKEKIAIIETAGKADKGNGARAPQSAPKAPVDETGREAAPVVGEANKAAVVRTSKYYSPLVKSLAAQHDISLLELESIQGSGHGGRVTKADFKAFLKQRGDAKAVASTAIDWAAEDTKIVPMSNMRQSIAEHMVRSMQVSPHVHSLIEVDMSKVAAWRNAHQVAFSANEGFRLSYTVFFLEA